jgi:hypothetical protein
VLSVISVELLSELCVKWLLWPTGKVLCFPAKEFLLEKALSYDRFDMILLSLSSDVASFITMTPLQYW